MNGKMQIENCKLKIENCRNRLSLSSLGLCVLCLFAGCPEQAHITVTIKPVAGAGAGGRGAASAASRRRRRRRPVMAAWSER